MKVVPDPMHHLLEVPNQGEHGKHRFYQHALVPFPPLTQLEVGWVSYLGMESTIGQDHHLIFKPLDQMLKMGIVDVGSGTIPSRHQAQVVEEQAELASNNPAMIGFPLLPHLMLATSLSYRMNQLDAVGIDDAQQGRLGQETMAPVLVSTQQPEEAGAVGQLGKQGQMVVRQPTLESPVTHPFNGVE